MPTTGREVSERASALDRPPMLRCKGGASASLPQASVSMAQAITPQPLFRPTPRASRPCPRRACARAARR
jgi:hypothetical protein